MGVETAFCRETGAYEAPGERWGAGKADVLKRCGPRGLGGSGSANLQLMRLEAVLADHCAFLSVSAY